MSPNELKTYTEEESIKVVIDKYNRGDNLSLVDIVILIASLGALTSSILTTLGKIKLPSDYAHAFIGKLSFEQRRIIEDILRELLGVCDCDRIIIGWFKNGTGVGADHFEKLFVRYEALSTGIGSVKNTLKDVDIAYLETHVMEGCNHVFKKQTVDDKNINTAYLSYLNNLNVGCTYSRLIGDDDSYYAIIELHVLSNNSDVTFSPEQVKKMNVIYNRVKHVLEYVRKNKRIPT